MLLEHWTINKLIIDRAVQSITCWVAAGAAVFKKNVSWKGRALRLLCGRAAGWWVALLPIKKEVQARNGWSYHRLQTRSEELTCAQKAWHLTVLSSGLLCFFSTCNTQHAACNMQLTCFVECIHSGHTQTVLQANDLHLKINSGKWFGRVHDLHVKIMQAIYLEMYMICTERQKCA